MVKKILGLMISIFIFGCKTSIDELQMQRKPYLGNELRIDGYYYSNILTVKGINYIGNHIFIAVFYRNGVCYNIGSRDIREDESISDFLGNLEREVLLDANYIKRLCSKGNTIGVFQVNNSILEMETLETSVFPTFKHYGEILNDTTFILKTINSKNGKVVRENMTYKFKQLSPKPDSTCVYIK